MSIQDSPTQGESAVFQPGMMVLIRLATLAPSIYNTQPWKFLVRENVIRIFPDWSRNLPVVDADMHSLYISLGCALENLLVAAEESGHNTQVAFRLDGTADESIDVHLTTAPFKVTASLYTAVPDRQCTRSAFDGKPIPDEDLEALMQASQQQHVGVHLFTSREEIEAITGFVKEAKCQQYSDPGYVDELTRWLRFNPKEVRAARDGMEFNTLGIPQMPRWAGRLMMKRFVTPKREATYFETMIQSASALMLFTAQPNDKQAWVDVGRSFERVSLTAVLRKIRLAHANSPCEVPELRSKLAQHLGLGSETPMLLVRLGYARPMPFSKRRAIQEVLI